MKILYDHQIFSQQEHGGISRYFYELARNLNELPEVEASILAPLHVNQYAPAAGNSFFSGRRLPKIPKTGRALRFINQAITWLKLARIAPDIVHSTYFHPTPSNRGRSVKTVVTVFDMIHERYPQHFAAHDHTAELKKQSVVSADQVICISETTRTDLLEICDLNPDKVAVVHLGFTLSHQTGAVNSLIDQPYLLYVGLRSGYKNFDRLLSAFARQPSLHRNFSLVCFGGGKFTSREYAQIAQAGLSSAQVRQVAGSDHDLASLYTHASVFVCPSLYEGFGIPPLEAMSFACPVACASTGSLPEVVGDAASFFDPLSEADMVRAILRILEDESYRLQLVSRGTARLKAFSWQKCATETLAIYRSLG